MKCSCGSSWECVCPTCHKYAPSDEWISVKDKLPSTQEAILAFCGKSMRVCTLNSVGWCLSGSFHEVDHSDEDWDYDLITIGNITHWQPLPEPPK